ncbi:MAG: IS200/IS605 family transposase [Bacteroidota bacterium]
MKPGVYTQLYTQLVFAVKHRECLLNESIRNEVFSYMSGLLTNKKHKSLIINGYTDHVHVFVGINPTVSVSDIVADLKRSSSLFINKKKISKRQVPMARGIWCIFIQQIACRKCI